MSYQRVLPRDLFNESKLLKGLGRLALLILDQKAPLDLEIVHDVDEWEGFDIRQDSSSGDLFVANLWLALKPASDDDEPLRINLGAPYNSRAPYSLTVDDEELGPIVVFTDDGDFTRDFLEYLRTTADRAWGQEK